MKIESIFTDLNKISGLEGQKGDFSQVMDAVGQKQDFAELMDTQRSIYQMHYQVELAARVGEAATGTVKRLQQGS